jgi:uroporphyrinogen decarboxylase
MGIDFDVSEAGKIQIAPVRTRQEFQQRVHRVSTEDFRRKCGFVGSVLEELREEVAISSPDTTVIGFVGLPFTLVSYLVEGKTGVSDGFPKVRDIIKDNPDVMHEMLSLLAENIVDYACYQIESGAQVIQVFDSWAGHIGDKDYETFCEPYQRRVIQGIKRQHDDTPVIIYMAPGPFSTGGRRLKLLAGTGADIVSVDHTIDMASGMDMLANHEVGFQGNLDPQILRDGPLEHIRSETLSILEKMKGKKRCILNLGHGILPDTPETHAECFVQTVQSFTN